MINLYFGTVPRFFNKGNFQSTNLEMHRTGNILNALNHCSDLVKCIYIEYK